MSKTKLAVGDVVVIDRHRAVVRKIVKDAGMMAEMHNRKWRAFVEKAAKNDTVLLGIIGDGREIGVFPVNVLTYLHRSAYAE